MSVSLYELFDIYIQSVQTDPIRTIYCTLLSSYTVFYILGISYYAATHFLIEWKTKMWATASDSQVIEEVKYIIRKHNECADLDTMESVITESINLTKYSQPYRVECYRQGLKDRVKALESV
jgi:hypothetical protein